MCFWPVAFALRLWKCDPVDKDVVHLEVVRRGADKLEACGGNVLDLHLEEISMGENPGHGCQNLGWLVEEGLKLHL